MNWDFNLLSELVDAPWEGGITKSELLDYAIRLGLSVGVIDNLNDLADDDTIYEDINEICWNWEILYEHLELTR